jgi:hypothetical protein
VITVSPALAGIPFIVDEDFEDAAVGDGVFSAGSVCFFGEDAVPGQVVDDGSESNQAYAISEHGPNEVFISDTAVTDFDLKFDYLSVQGPFPPFPFMTGIPAVFFRADPGNLYNGNMTDGGGVALLTTLVEEEEKVCELDPLGGVGVSDSDLAGFHTMRVLVKNDKIKVFRDGELMVSVKDSTNTSGYITITEQNGGVILIDNITLKVKVGN